jgi:hypothetical protein
VALTLIYLAVCMPWSLPARGCVHALPMLSALCSHVWSCVYLLLALKLACPWLCGCVHPGGCTLCSVYCAWVICALAAGCPAGWRAGGCSAPESASVHPGPSDLRHRSPAIGMHCGTFCSNAYSTSRHLCLGAQAHCTRLILLPAMCPPAAYQIFRYTSKAFNNTYNFNNEPVDQATGQARCNDQGGHLASYLSLGEQAEVEKYFIDMVSRRPRTWPVLLPS